MQKCFEFYHRPPFLCFHSPVNIFRKRGQKAFPYFSMIMILRYARNFFEVIVDWAFSRSSPNVEHNRMYAKWWWWCMNDVYASSYTERSTASTSGIEWARNKQSGRCWPAEQSSRREHGGATRARSAGAATLFAYGSHAGSHATRRIGRFWPSILIRTNKGVLQKYGSIYKNTGVFTKIWEYLQKYSLLNLRVFTQNLTLVSPHSILLYTGQLS